MNFERFIAGRVAMAGQKSFASWIIRIAIIAVGLSLSVMIVSFSMISGFKKEISDKIFGFWGHIHITDANISNSFETIPISKNQDFLYDLDTLSTIKYQEQLSILGIPLPGRYRERNLEFKAKSTYPFAFAPVIINSKDEFEGMIVRGLGEDYNWSDFEQYITQGRAIRYQPNVASAEILISESTANRLNVKLGDNIIINIIKNGQRIRRRTNIVGFYKTGLEEYDQRFLIADLKKVQELLKWNENQVAGFELVLDNIEELGLINEWIYFEILPSRLFSMTIREKFPNIFEWLELQDFNAIVILILMVIVAIINMITSIIILIIERSKMIGVLKSLGSTNWSIRKIFLYYAGVITFFGLILGNLIGVGLCLIQKYTGVIKLDEANYYLSQAPINLDFSTVLLLNIFAFLSIILVLIIPTVIIAKVNPIRILHFQ